MTLTLRYAAVAALASVTAFASANMVVNPSFENNVSGQFGPPNGYGGQGGWAFHAGFQKPGYNAGIMGASFGYYTPRDESGDAIVQQILQDRVNFTDYYYKSGAKYTFDCYAVGGGDGVGTAIFQLGYKIAGAFIPLATKNEPTTNNAWTKMAGLTYFSPTDRFLDDVITMQLGPGRLNPPTFGPNNSDIWVDVLNINETENPGTGVIAGDVTLEDWVPQAEPNSEASFLKQAQTPLMVELLDGTGAVVESALVGFSNDRKFQFFTAKRGNFVLRVKASHWLAKTMSVNITNAGVSGLSFSLLNGDIDGDNSVTVFDYSALSDNFDKTANNRDEWEVSETGIAAFQCDLDGDDAITVFDYGILSNNFDQSGE